MEQGCTPIMATMPGWLSASRQHRFVRRAVDCRQVKRVNPGVIASFPYFLPVFIKLSGIKMTVRIDQPHTIKSLLT